MKYTKKQLIKLSLNMLLIPDIRYININTLSLNILQPQKLMFAFISKFLRRKLSNRHKCNTTVWFIVYNVFTPTRNARGMSIHRSDKELTKT